MTQQTVIVTGASRGIGAAVARNASRVGANVVLMARSAEALEQVAAQVAEAGGEALVIQGDVSDIEDCRKVVAQTVERFGQVDAVVNNAGLLQPIARLAEADMAAWRELMDVNLNGPAQMIQAALPYLRATRGRVINVSSGAAVNPKAGWGAYAISKAAMNMLNRMLALEEPQVTAVAVRPGKVDTAMQAVIREEGGTGMLPADHELFVKLYESGELESPEGPGTAIAALALYAPHTMSGEYVSWNDEAVQAIVSRCCR
jgi:NAD(P)-dependent dehydrogenase (short-subunit alcohol dehydrogenase family)